MDELKRRWHRLNRETRILPSPIPGSLGLPGNCLSSCPNKCIVRIVAQQRESPEER